MIFEHEPGWDPRWAELDDSAMGYETAVIALNEDDYLTEFYDFYKVRPKYRTAKLIASPDGFRETLRGLCRYGAAEPIAEKTERLFGLPRRVMVFDDDAALLDVMGGRRGYAPFFFVFGMMFCEYGDFTLCFMSGTNN